MAPNAESSAESHHWSSQTSKVVANFSLIARNKVKKAKSREESSQICSNANTDGAQPIAPSVAVSDTDHLATGIKTVLEDRTRAFKNDLLQKRPPPKVKVNEPKAGATHATSEKFESDGGEPHQRNGLKASEYTSPIEIEEAGSISVDLTSIAVLSVLVSPDVSEAQASTQCKCAREDGCPLMSLAAAKVEWWDRPLWAWNWRELVLAHATIVSHDILKALPSQDARWTVAVSTDKGLAKLFSSLHSKDRDAYDQSSLTPILIDPIVDALVVDRVMQESSANDDSQSAQVQPKSLDSGKRNEETLVTKGSNDNTSVPTQSTMEKAERKDSPIADETDVELLCTPETANKQHVVAQTVAKVTPEPERIVEPSGPGQKPEAIDAHNSHKAISSRPKSPQYDSSGVDITMLSQLPASVRSEARIAMALSENMPLSRRKQEPVMTRGSLPTLFSRAERQNKDTASKSTQSTGTTWLSAGKVDEATLRELPQDIQQMIQSELSDNTISRPKRKRTGIASFFQSRGKRLK